MTLVASHLTTDATSQNLNAYTTASIAPAAERLIVIAVGGSRTTAQIPEVSGLGLTWTQQNGGAALLGTINYSTYLFTAWTGAIAPSPGSLTITWPGTTMTGCQWSVSEWAGVDNAAGPIVQSLYGKDEAGLLTPLLTLAAFASSTNGTWGCVQTNNTGETIAAGSGFTLFGQASNAGPNAKLASEGRIDADTTVDFGGVATTTPWGMVAAEIREAAGVAPTNHIVGDSVVGTDEVSVTSASDVADTGAGADMASVSAESVAADTAAGSDTVATTSESVVTDVGTGADIAAVASALTVTDTATGADTVVAVVETDIVRDSFNRADNANEIGVGESGHAWTAQVDAYTDWGIVSNQGYKSATGYGIITVESGIANGEMILDMSVVTGEFWAIFRLTDGNNYWRFGRASGAYVLRKIVGNASQTPVNHNAFNTATPADGDRIRIKFEADDSVNAYVTPVGGAEILVSGAGDTFNITATKHGIAAFASTAPVPARFQNLTVSAMTNAVVVDTGFGADSVVTATAGTSLDDTGVGSDTVAVTAASTVDDAGSGADAVTVGAEETSLNEFGVGADAVSVAVSSTVADVATGSDAAVTSAAVIVSETASGTDAVSAATAIVVTDAGTGTDTLAVVASVTVPDVVVGDDAVTLTAAVIVGDVGAGTDVVSAPLVAMVTVTDVAAGEDVVTIFDATLFPAVVSVEGNSGYVSSTEASPPGLSLVEAGSARHLTIE